ncbi:aldo/keto reductase [Rhodoplanes roseus]|uniref:Aldo/keto reductase n=2 Tax=Rhodoplanes roseus TaxID=29409 RepID=A0A327KX83_9BRAD|nr:aldo/keto reductase [Rhodoplanes roseus]RAI42747.1 aldo/keto reductase [Rhodoplanes roseus]
MATAGAAALPWRSARGQPAPVPITKTIPSSGEAVPAVGLGTWITFNVGTDAALRDECAAVVAAFFAAGGRLIDSSPMYGSSQPTVGYALERLGAPETLFSAEKVWTSNPRNGPPQIAQSLSYWGVPRFDLVQVHNLLSWEAHLDTLAAMKAAKSIRYVGITTSEGRRQRDIEAVMASRPIDFVQVTYNPADREVESRILPLARERGIAVIVNRPFREGELTQKLARRPLPDWAAEIGATTWAQLVLKFIVSHPAVTCAIPATTRVDHVRENLAAASGAMPDEAFRRRIADAVGRA